MTGKIAVGRFFLFVTVTGKDKLDWMWLCWKRDFNETFKTFYTSLIEIAYNSAKQWYTIVRRWWILSLETWPDTASFQIASDQYHSMQTITLLRVRTFCLPYW